jgi:hypothetical protein
VVGHRQSDGPDKIERGTGEQPGAERVVPVGDCPDDGGDTRDGCRRARAFITKLENAKRAPALSPQPSAVTKVKATRRSSIVPQPQAPTGDAFQTPVAAVARA